MNDDLNREKTDSEETPDLRGLQDLSFGPNWAQKDPAASVPRADPERTRDPRRGSRGRRDRSSSGSSNRGGRHHEGKRESRPRRSDRPANRPVPLMRGIRVSFSPDQQALNVLVKLIRHNGQVYRLNELTALLMKQALKSCVVKLEKTSPESPSLFQCTTDRAVFCREESARDHLLGRFLTEHYEAQEVEVDPPKGNFQYVARCSLSGEVLAPPNHHAYTQILTEHWTSRFSNMPFEAYKSKVELTSDEEQIEAWKKAASTETRYVPRPEPSAEPEAKEPSEPLTLEQVMQQFQAGGLTDRITAVDKASIPPSSIESCEEELKRLIGFVAGRESDRPTSIQYALKAALKHKGLVVFKRTGEIFVAPVEPRPVGADQLAAEPGDVLQRIQQAEPEGTRTTLFEALASSGDREEDLKKAFSLLKDRGHILEFSDGRLITAASLKPSA